MPTHKEVTDREAGRPNVRRRCSRGWGSPQLSWVEVGPIIWLRLWVCIWVVLWLGASTYVARGQHVRGYSLSLLPPPPPPT